MVIMFRISPNFDMQNVLLDFACIFKSICVILKILYYNKLKYNGQHIHKLQVFP